MTRAARGALRRCVVFALLAGGCTEHVSLLAPEDAGLHSPPLVVADAQAGGTTDVDLLRRTACSDWTADGGPDPALLMMLIDVSGSMTFADPTSNGTVSKWGVERPVLSSTIDTFPPSFGVGVLYYPNMPTPASTSMRPSSACINTAAMIGVDYLGMKGSRQRYMIQQSLAMTEPNTQEGTPTMDAYLVALRALGNVTLGGSRNIVLITDGQPTFAEGCVGTGDFDVPVDETPIIDAISQAKRAGVNTFVIGSPGSEQGAITGVDARPWLSRAAQAGGTARPGCSNDGPKYCHYDMVEEPNFGAGLTAALGDIGGTVGRCDVQLPAAPPNRRLDPNQVNVVLTTSDGRESLLTHDESPACANGEGWQYGSDHGRITLCAETCQRLRADDGAQIEVLAGCAPSMRSPP